VRVDSQIIGVEKRGNSIAVNIESTGEIISQVAGTHMLVATVGDQTLTTLASTRRVSLQTGAGISRWTTS
jgi:hypothetical protein